MIFMLKEQKINYLFIKKKVLHIFLNFIPNNLII